MRAARTRTFNPADREEPARRAADSRTKVLSSAVVKKHYVLRDLVRARTSRTGSNWARSDKEVQIVVPTPLTDATGLQNRVDAWPAACEVFCTSDRVAALWRSTSSHTTRRHPSRATTAASPSPSRDPASDAGIHRFEDPQFSPTNVCGEAPSMRSPAGTGNLCR